MEKQLMNELINSLKENQSMFSHGKFPVHFMKNKYIKEILYYVSKNYEVTAKYVVPYKIDVDGQHLDAEMAIFFNDGKFKYMLSAYEDLSMFISAKEKNDRLNLLEIAYGKATKSSLEKMIRKLNKELIYKYTNFGGFNER